MPDLVADWNYLESWGYRASDAHNGYLNLAVTTGLVGLGLSLWWIIVATVCGFWRATVARRPTGRCITLFLQIWFFGLCLAVRIRFLCWRQRAVVFDDVSHSRTALPDSAQRVLRDPC